MNKTILIIRKADEFSKILAANCFEIINLPLIETKPLANLSDFEAKLENLNKYHGIFLTSRNAARIFVEKLSEKRKIFYGKVYVLGKKSFEILKSSHLNLHYDKQANTAREMLESIASEDLKDRKFLFIRGDKSLRVLPDFLRHQAVADETIVYETHEIQIEISKRQLIAAKFGSGEIAATVLFSPSAAQSFLAQFGTEILHQTVIAAIGKTTADFFERQNLRVGFVSSKSNSEVFAGELTEYVKNRTMDNG